MVSVGREGGNAILFAPEGTTWKPEPSALTVPGGIHKAISCIQTRDEGGEHEFSRRLGINQVTKLSVDSRAQFLLLFEPFTHSTGAAVSGNRPGEVFGGKQAVILPGNKDKRPTISAQYLRRLYASPAPELDLGTFVQSATILLSEDLGGFHVDMNGLVMEQQDDRTKLRRAQFAQTLSISHPIGKFTVSAEVWHFAQPVVHSYAVGNLWAASYPVGKNLVIDTGFDHGFTGTATQWEGFAGFTYLLPRRLWSNH